jgi:hypothetical protein
MQNTTKHQCEISCSVPLLLPTIYASSTQANQMIVIHIPQFLLLF